jgi:hypothetical protein
MCVVAWLSDSQGRLDVSYASHPDVHVPPAPVQSSAVFAPSIVQVPHAASVVTAASVVHVPAWVGP